MAGDESWRIYVEETPWAFGGYRRPLEGAEFAVYGVPLDSTASYRTGQRWGPYEVRRASAFIEFNSLRTGVDVDEVSVADAGDVAVVHGDVRVTLERVARVSSALARLGLVPLMIGGEHTATLAAYRGVTEALGEPPCMVVFDAHFDLRDEYLGLRLSHATFMRRLVESTPPPQLVYVGVRGFSRDEQRYAAAVGAAYYTPRDIASLGEANVAASIRRRLSNCKSVYVSIDLDVLDPAYAPGVGNPEPEGLSTFTLYEILSSVADERLAGGDVVEAAPPHDCTGVTSVTAAKTLVEMIAAAHAARRRRRA